MYALRYGLRPPRRQELLLCGAIAILPLALSGCSSTRTHQTGGAVYSWLSSEPPPPPHIPVKRDLEDDGVEAQTAPSRHVRALPDDPSQPWSRNYGAVPSATGKLSASDVDTEASSATEAAPPTAARRPAATGQVATGQPRPTQMASDE